jgi:hypothetical protein
MTSGHQFRKSETHIGVRTVGANVLISHSQVHISGSDIQYLTPRQGQHKCCLECFSCYRCERCEEYESDERPPQELRDMIALFPNTTDIYLKWEVSDDGMYDLEPTHDGRQLRNVERFFLSLRSERDESTYRSEQAAEAKMILASLHMPSLETIIIDFKISNEGLGYEKLGSVHGCSKHSALVAETFDSVRIYCSPPSQTLS